LGAVKRIKVEIVDGSGDDEDGDDEGEDVDI